MHPVGRRPPNVYWRRRVVALVLLVVVLALVVWGVTALVGALRGDDPAADAPTGSVADAGDTEGSAATAPTTQAGTGTGTEAQGEGEVPACGADTTAVVATADAASYALGATAVLGMTITNTGTVPCTLDAGSAALELLVVSGEDRIWSSDDCQEAPENRPTTVEPGEAGMLASSVEWPLARSAEGCADDLPALKAGTYQLTARAGEITSAPVVLQLTG